MEFSLEKLDKLEKLAKVATPGPWDVAYLRTNVKFVFAQAPNCDMVFHAREEDVKYITAACNSLPTLIAENRALQERVRELETQRGYLLDKVIIEDNTDDMDYCPISVDYPCSYRSKCGWGCETGSREQRKVCWIKFLEKRAWV